MFDNRYELGFVTLRTSMARDNCENIAFPLEVLEFSNVNFDQCVDAALELWSSYFDQCELEDSIIKIDKESIQYLKNLRKRLLILGSIMNLCCNPSAFSPQYNMFAVALGNFNDGLIDRTTFLDLVRQVKLDPLRYSEIVTAENGEIIKRIAEHVAFILQILSCEFLDVNTFHFVRKKIRDLKNLLQMIYLIHPSASLYSTILIAEDISKFLGDLRSQASDEGSICVSFDNPIKDNIYHFLSTFSFS